MSTITVDGRTAGLIEGASGILRSLKTGEPSPFEGKTKQVPLWNPDGTEVKSIQQAAVVMGVTPEVAAQYVIEQGVESLMDEAKVLRRVRTAAGVRRFKQPIGSIIVRDAIGALKNITDKGASEYDGANDVKGADGKTYHVFEDPDEKGSFYATESTGDFWDTVVGGSGMSEEDVYIALDNHVAKKVGKPQKAPDKPMSRAVKRPDPLAERSAAQQRREAAGFAREEAAKRRAEGVAGAGKVKLGDIEWTKDSKGRETAVVNGHKVHIEKHPRGGYYWGVGGRNQGSIQTAAQARRSAAEAAAGRPKRGNNTDTLKTTTTKKPKASTGEGRDLRGTRGATLSEAIQLQQRQGWSKPQRDEFLKLNGDGQAAYLERVKDLEAANIDYTHQDVMDHVKGRNPARDAAIQQAIIQTALGDEAAARRTLRESVRAERRQEGAIATAKAPKTTGPKKHGTYAVGDEVVIQKSSRKALNGKKFKVTADSGGTYTLTDDKGNSVNVAKGTAPAIMYHPSSKEFLDANNADMTRRDAADQFSVGDEVDFTYRGQSLTGVVKQRRANGNIVIHVGNHRYTVKNENVKPKAAASAPGGVTSQPTGTVAAMARRAVQINRPVDAFRYTTQMQKRAQADYDQWVKNANVEDLQKLRDELIKLSKSGAADVRQKAEARNKATMLDTIIKRRKGGAASDALRAEGN